VPALGPRPQLAQPAWQQPQHRHRQLSSHQLPQASSSAHLASEEQELPSGDAPGSDGAEAPTAQQVEPGTPGPAQQAAALQQHAGGSNGSSGRGGGSKAAGDLRWSDVWGLLAPDWRLLAACSACAVVSVVCNVFVAPTMGHVIDVIGRGRLATTRELAAAVGRLGAVYVCSNVTLAGQVRRAGGRLPALWIVKLRVHSFCWLRAAWKGGRVGASACSVA
jgi:hypothetical protein